MLPDITGPRPLLLPATATNTVGTPSPGRERESLIRCFCLLGSFPDKDYHGGLVPSRFETHCSVLDLIHVWEIIRGIYMTDNALRCSKLMVPIERVIYQAIDCYKNRCRMPSKRKRPKAIFKSHLIFITDIFEYSALSTATGILAICIFNISGDRGPWHFLKERPKKKTKKKMQPWNTSKSSYVGQHTQTMKSIEDSLQQNTKMVMATCMDWLLIWDKKPVRYEYSASEYKMPLHFSGYCSK